MADQAHYRKLEAMYAKAPINAWFAPQLTVGDGCAELHLPLRDEFHHTAGAVHGTVYFKALDDATFFAANSRVPDRFVLTAQFEIELLAPVVHGTLVARAQVTGEDAHRIIAQGELFDGEGRLIARGVGRFARSDLPLDEAVGYGGL